MPKLKKAMMNKEYYVSSTGLCVMRTCRTSDLGRNGIEVCNEIFLLRNMRLLAKLSH